MVGYRWMDGWFVGCLGRNSNNKMRDKDKNEKKIREWCFLSSSQPPPPSSGSVERETSIMMNFE